MSNERHLLDRRWLKGSLLLNDGLVLREGPDEVLVLGKGATEGARLALGVDVRLSNMNMDMLLYDGLDDSGRILGNSSDLWSVIANKGGFSVGGSSRIVSDFHLLESAATIFNRGHVDGDKLADAGVIIADLDHGCLFNSLSLVARIKGILCDQFTDAILVANFEQC